MALLKHNQIIQDKNSKFLDNINKIMGNDWNLSCEITEPQFSYGNQDVKQWIGIELRVGKGKSGYSFVTPGVLLTDDLFNQYLNNYNGKRLDDEVCLPLLNRDKLNMKNKLTESLKVNQSIQPKKLKL